MSVGKAGMDIDNGRDAKLRAQGKLVMEEVHGPYIVGSNCLLTILAKLCLYPPLRVFVPELKAQLFVKYADLLDVDHLPLPARQDMHAPIAIAHARFADFLDRENLTDSTRFKRGILMRFRSTDTIMASGLSRRANRPDT